MPLAFWVSFRIVPILYQSFTVGIDRMTAIKNGKTYMKKCAILLLFPLLAACVEDTGPMEVDMSEANINTDCPVDVSEADRADYPACN